MRWLPGGEGYCCSVANVLNFFGTESEEAYLTITSEKQILCTAWISVISRSGYKAFELCQIIAVLRMYVVAGPDNCYRWRREVCFSLGHANWKALCCAPTPHKQVVQQHTPLRLPAPACLPSSDAFRICRPRSGWPWCCAGYAHGFTVKFC